MAKTQSCILIGAEDIRAIAIKRRRGGYKIVGAAARTLAIDERDSPGPALRAMMKKVKSADSHAVLCLPKEQATLHVVSLPSNKPEELVTMARFEAERHIPFHAERHTVAYHVLRDQGRMGSEVLLAAADQPVVDRAIAAAQNAGIHPEGLTVSSAGLVNALLYSLPDLARTKMVALVSIGLRFLDLVFTVEGRVVFSRSIPIGLAGLIQEWTATTSAANLHLDETRLAAAAKMIDMMDLEQEYSEEEKPLGSDRRPGDIARTWAERLIQEIRRTYEFARREMGCPAIEALVLAGEGAILRNLDRYLYVNLNVEVQVLNPVVALKGADLAPLPFGGLELTVPFGVAIQDDVEGACRLDLTPQTFHRQVGRRRLIRHSIAAAAMTLVTCGLAAAAYVEFQDNRSQLTRRYIEASQALRPTVTKLKDEQKQLSILEAFLNAPTSALAVLDFINGYEGIPNKRIGVRGVNFAHGDNVVIEGHAIHIDDVTDFEEALRNSGMFDSVEVKERRWATALRGRPEVYVFTIDCEIPESAVTSPGRSASSSRRSEPAPVPRGETDLR